MSYRVQLANDSFQAEPGIAAPVAVEVVNEGPARLTVETQVEGVDPNWVANPVPSIQIEPGETVTERFFLKAPREPESLAGTYPFVVTVRSENNGEVKRLPASLEVLTFHHLSIDVQPRRGTVSKFSPHMTFKATVMNLGNVEHSVQVSADDHDDLFTFECDPEDVVVPPGAQKTVNVTANAKKPALIANARLQQFSVGCRSKDRKNVAATAHGQIEQRAFITPSVLALFVLFVVIVTAFVAFYPKKPAIDILTVSPDRMLLTDGTASFAVSWSASNAKSVTLIVDGRTQSNLGPSGERTFTVDHEGDIEVLMTAHNGRRNSEEEAETVRVREPEPVPDPVIVDFRIEPSVLVTGQEFQVYYTFNDAVTEAFLSPRGLVLDPRGEGTQLTADIVGEFEYKIVARNKAGQSVEASIPVTIAQGSKATIETFLAEPAIVDLAFGRVTIRWAVTNASKIELLEGEQTFLLEEQSGEKDFMISAETTYTLTVYDVDDNSVTRVVTVQVKEPDDFFEANVPVAFRDGPLSRS